MRGRLITERYFRSTSLKSVVDAVQCNFSFGVKNVVLVFLSSMGVSTLYSILHFKRREVLNRRPFLARHVIYTSRAYAMMPVRLSVCL